MKPNTHPNAYRTVIFEDVTNGVRFLTRSCAETRDTAVHEGVEYPLYKADITALSHPFYTGQQIMLDTAGRVERFNKRFAKSTKQTAEPKA